MSIKDYIIEQIKDSELIYKNNELYLRMFELNCIYKVLIRRDVGLYSHNEKDHYNIEIQTTKGNKKFSFYIFFNPVTQEVLDTKIYQYKKKKLSKNC